MTGMPALFSNLRTLDPRRAVMENLVAMSKELVAETIEVARQIEDQLKFYREIGLEDIGNSAHPAGSALTSDFTQSVSQPAELASAADKAQISQAEPPMQGDTTRVEQAGLFGDMITTSQQSNTRSRTASLPVLETLDSSMEAIREDLGDCHRCKLHEHRKTIVFGEGNLQARLVFVGEGPGAEEDITGRPFVGRAGQLLDKIIGAISLRREDVYIANIVKCRPPGNRAPERDEVATCEPFLFRQLAFIRPDVIVALGSPAFQCLLRTRESITRARGEWREWNGIKLMPTFHPAFLLRSPDKKREVWEDMKKVRDFLNSK